MERVLIVDDNPDIREVLGTYAAKEGFEPITAKDGFEALDLFRKTSPAVILLDVMMPGMDGYRVCERIRSESDVPIILITAKGEDYERVMGLDIGADDYIVKPFEMLEVMVRLEKVLERNGTVQEQIQIGDVIIDTASRTVTKMGMEIYLKPMEYNCLMVFAKNPNKALTRNQILQELWNEEFCGETRTVDAHVGRIRKKLGWQDKIKTIPRIGYRLEVDL